MPEIRALSLLYFKTEIAKGNKELVVRAFAVRMKNSSGVVSVISAFRMAPPAATEVDSDGDAEDEKNRSQEVLSKMATVVPIGCARTLGLKLALDPNSCVA
jgi:hypothetical protein